MLSVLRDSVERVVVSGWKVPQQWLRAIYGAFLSRYVSSRCGRPVPETLSTREGRCADSEDWQRGWCCRQSSAQNRIRDAHCDEYGDVAISVPGPNAGLNGVLDLGV